MNLVKSQDAKLIHRNLLHSDTLTMKDQKEKVRKELQLTYIKNNKILTNIFKRHERNHYVSLQTIMKIKTTKFFKMSKNLVYENSLSGFLKGQRFIFYFPNFWLCHEACRISVLQPDGKPIPSAVKVWSLNH